MGAPEPIEPEESARPLPPAADSKSGGTADWLCGPDEGLEAEISRGAKESSEAAPAPKLFRPGVDGTQDAPGGTPPPRRPTPIAPGAAGGPARESTRLPDRLATPGAEPEAPTAAQRAQAWTAAASSIPAVRRETPMVGTPSFPAEDDPNRDFPTESPEEREARLPTSMPLPDGARPHEVVSPALFDVPEPALPWWLRVRDALVSNRRVQILAGLLVLLIAAVFAWPRGDKPTPVGVLRRHPDRYDGRDVKVTGKVGEVFNVGGGWAYYLHQGRDTLVVFTRSGQPHSRQNVTVTGQLSTGYLDGVARIALFQEAGQ